EPTAASAASSRSQADRRRYLLRSRADHRMSRPVASALFHRSTTRLASSRSSTSGRLAESWLYRGLAFVGPSAQYRRTTGKRRGSVSRLRAGGDALSRFDVGVAYVKGC